MGNGVGRMKGVRIIGCVEKVGSNGVRRGG